MRRWVFRRRGEGIAVALDARERRIVRLARDIVDGVGIDADDPASVRLAYEAHPDDPDADRRFRELTASNLDEARAADRSAFTESLDKDLLTEEEAEAWLRVIGDARLALAARLGITEDGWEESVGPGDPPEQLLVGYLGGIQHELATALMAG